MIINVPSLYWFVYSKVWKINSNQNQINCCAVGILWITITGYCSINLNGGFMVLLKINLCTVNDLIFLISVCGS